MRLKLVNPLPVRAAVRGTDLGSCPSTPGHDFCRCALACVEEQQVTRVAGGADAILPRNVRPSAPHMTFPALVAKAMARNDTTVLDPLASTWYGCSRSPA